MSALSWIQIAGGIAAMLSGAVAVSVCDALPCQPGEFLAYLLDIAEYAAWGEVA